MINNFHMRPQAAAGQSRGFRVKDMYYGLWENPEQTGGIFMYILLHSQDRSNTEKCFIVIILLIVV